MKTINVTFETVEIENLKKVKGDMTWREFILECSKKKILDSSEEKK